MVLQYLFEGGFKGMAEDIPGLTRWDLCMAMANAQAILLANVPDMTEMQAFQRFEHLRDIMRDAFEQKRRDGLGKDEFVGMNGQAPSSD